VCRGSGFHGQLGMNASRKRCTVNPAPIDFPHAVQQVCAGGNHSAILTDDGRVFTFGAGQYGQCGNLPRKHNMLPTPQIVDFFVTYKIIINYIACGQNHSAAISSTGKLYTWGRGKSGALGHGIRADERFPRLVDLNYRDFGIFIRVKCGAQHTMVLTDKGELLSFGTGAHGQLGHGNNQDLLRPTLISCEQWMQNNNNHKIVDIDCGSTLSAAVTEAGECYIW
jgi:alpha-tubulin suppressor-like RCC1 family protein